MPRIRCYYMDCVFLEEGFCRAAAIELDSDVGCMTYSRTSDLEAEDSWEDEDQELSGWDEIDDEDEDDELWLEDDEI